MKQHLIAAATLLIIYGSSATTAQAQLQVSVNIGVQPAWGPVGYDYARFYYFPDHDFYYDVVQARYVVWQRGRWVYLSAVPVVGFSPYRSYKVVLTQPQAYLYHDNHIRSYASYKGRKPQPMIRDSRDEHYFESRYHPMHKQWKGNKGHHDSHPGKGKGRKH